jgi:HEAT repeat protein
MNKTTLTLACTFVVLASTLLLTPLPAKADRIDSPALRSRCLGILKASLTSGDVDTRRSTAQLLYELSPDESLPLLDQALGDRDERVLQGALFALGKVNAPGSEKLLDRAMASRLPSVREAAIQVMGESGRLSDILKLKKIYSERSGMERLYAAASMALLGDHSGITCIREAAAGKEIAPKREALFFLGKLKDRESLPLLCREAVGTDKETARMALLGLGYVRDPGSLPLLLSALKSSDDAMKGAAILSLGKRDEKETRTALADMLSDGDWRIRNDIVEILPSWGTAGVSYLEKALNDPHFLVRIKAAGALAKKGNEDALSSLKKDSTDSDEMVRKFSVRAMGSLGQAGLIPLLTPLLNDESPMVKPEAARAILKLMAPGK